VKLWYQLLKHCNKKYRNKIMLIQGDTESRTRYLLRVAAAYTKQNPDFTIDYDETTCDGMCLSEELYEESQQIK
jgi:hypothetical protein